MPLIDTRFEERHISILIIRIIVGFVWLATVFRRLSSNFGDFESRIKSMSEGQTLFPEVFMDFAVSNWLIFYFGVLSIEILVSLSLLTGTLARGGALLATINGFAIGMGGIGLGITDLIIPWSVAILSLILLLFTHPGIYKGFDSILSEKKLPKFIKIFI